MLREVKHTLLRILGSGGSGGGAGHLLEKVSSSSNLHVEVSFGKIVNVDGSV